MRIPQMHCMFQLNIFISLSHPPAHHHQVRRGADPLPPLLTNQTSASGAGVAQHLLAASNLSDRVEVVLLQLDHLQGGDMMRSATSSPPRLRE